MEPISPKLELLKLVDPEMATTPLPPNPGALKLGWLVMLNISVRNWRRLRSLNGMSLKTEKSRRWNPGPGTCAGPPPSAEIPQLTSGAPIDAWVHFGG